MSEPAHTLTPCANCARGYRVRDMHEASGAPLCESCYEEWLSDPENAEKIAKKRGEKIARSNSDKPRRKSKLTEEQWGELLARARGGESQAALAREYGIGRTQVRRRLGLA